MRLRFEEGQQKLLLKDIKKKHSFSWKEFAKFLGISKSSLLDLSREKNLLPSRIYKKIDPQNKYKNKILEIKREGWGKIKGGLNSRGSLKQIKIPKKDERLAELIGIILGDGNILSYTKGKKIGVYHIRIAGDYNKDKEYHLNYIKPLCDNLFGITAKVHTLSTKRERFISLYSKRLVNYFKKMGLKPGNKIKNQSTIPKWVFSNKSFLQSCVRGLIDTDGSIFRMSNKDPSLLRINFKNHDMSLLRDTRNAFIRLGFNPSKIIDNKVFYISRKEEIVRYINEIGFSNLKHSKRFQKFTAL